MSYKGFLKISLFLFFIVPSNASAQNGDPFVNCDILFGPDFAAVDAEVIEVMQECYNGCDSYCRRGTFTIDGRLGEQVTIADAIAIATYLFMGGSVGSLGSWQMMGDADDSVRPVDLEGRNILDFAPGEAITGFNLADVLYILNYLFRGGPAPALYISPTEEGLGCRPQGAFCEIAPAFDTREHPFSKYVALTGEPLVDATGTQLLVCEIDSDSQANCR